MLFFGINNSLYVRMVKRVQSILARTEKKYFRILWSNFLPLTVTARETLLSQVIFTESKMGFQLRYV